MAVFFPPDAKAKDAPSGPEQQVLDALRRELDDSWIVVPNLHLAKHPKHLRGEADVVLIREGVVIVVEVKGGTISRDKKGKWVQNGRELKCPVSQAIGNFEAVKLHTKTASGRFAMADWCCIFPQSSFEVKSIEWRHDQVLDIRLVRSGLGEALMRLHDRIVGEQLPKLGSSARLSEESTRGLLNLLKPEVDGSITCQDLVELAELDIANLEQEQIDALGVIRSNPRVLLSGCAGSGKTVLGYLACMARINEDPQARVAFVCCSDFLAADIRKLASRSTHASRLDILSLSDLTAYFWERIVIRDTTFKPIGSCAFQRDGQLESWILGERTATEDPVMLEALLVDMLREGKAERARIDISSIHGDSPICDRLTRREAAQYDLVVLDEAQDFIFTRAELAYLSVIIKGGFSEGSVVWIQDTFQSIRPFFLGYAPDDMPTQLPESLGYVQCPLPPKNYRNPPGVAKLASRLNPGQAQRSLRNPTMVSDVEVVDCPGGKIGEALDRVLLQLQRDGVSGIDIVVITADGQDDSHFNSGSRHGAFIVCKVPSNQEDVVLSTRTDIVRAMDLLEAKGREFPVVILVDVPFMELDYERNFMLVAVTRAKAKLYILCGHERKQALMGIVGEL